MQEKITGNTAVRERTTSEEAETTVSRHFTEKQPHVALVSSGKIKGENVRQSIPKVAVQRLIVRDFTKRFTYKATKDAPIQPDSFEIHDTRKLQKRAEIKREIFKVQRANTEEGTEKITYLVV